MSTEAAASAALPPPVVAPPPSRLVAALPPVGNTPPDDLTTVPAIVPAVSTLAAEAPASAPIARSAAGGNVFVVRFDDKLTALTPTGLRALDAALRAAEGGRRIKIEIAGCEDRDSTPAGVDCAALARGLKWILAQRGVTHPGNLVARLDPTTVGVLH